MSSEKDDLVFLANVMRERRRRQLSMHVMLQNLVARRRRVLNVAVLMLLLISQLNNITVPGPIRSCRRLKRNAG